ncbi:MAG: FAD binding domain-containing protein [Planctomycetes bacterium]|nr:FAD binding domain-containing protein [Planctomycetota bacterium]
MLRLPEFTYHRPRTAAEAVRLAAEHGPAAMFVAGGTDLYPNMKRRQQTPTEVVSLAGIPELQRIEGDPAAGVRVGAMVRLSTIEGDPMLRAAYPALVRAVTLISTPHLRNMGTIGGNLLLDTRCNYYDQTHEWRESVHFCMKKDGDTCWVAPGSPRCWAVQSSDTVPLLCAMDAEVSLLSTSGERRIPVRDLYRDDGMRFLTKAPGEVLTALHLPAVGSWRASYRKLRRRGTYDFPVLGVGVCLHMDGATVREARIRMGGAGSYAIPATAAEDLLRGKRLTPELVEQAAQLAYKPSRPMDNTDFDANWRKKMAPVFVARALRDCLG